MALMRVGEYARHRGVTSAAVTIAVREGRISKSAEGLIDSDVADRQWAQRTDPVNSRTSQRRKPRVGSMSALADGDTSVQDGYLNARAMREAFEARLAKIKYEQQAGKLVPADEVKIAAFNRFRILKEACMNIPNRMAAQLASERESDVVHELLEREIRLIFQDFSDGKLG